MNETKCHTCQLQAKRDSGQELTPQELNHWMMWGCTCTAESQTEALEWMAKVTR